MVSSSQQEILITRTEELVHIDVALIPPHSQEVLAAATLDFIHDLLNHQGGREALDLKKAELGLC